MRQELGVLNAATAGVRERVAKWRRRVGGMRLSTRLIIVIVVCLMPTVAFQLLAAWTQWAERKEQLGAIVVQKAQLLAGNASSVVEAARILLGAAAEFRQVRQLGSECHARLASLTQHAPGFAFLALVNDQGGVVCSSDDGLTEGTGDAPWSRDVAGIRGFEVGRFARSSSYPGGVLPFYMPMPGGGSGSHSVLVAGLDLGWLGAHLQGLKRKNLPVLGAGILTIADADGRVLGRDERHADFVGQRFPDAALPLLQAAQPGTLRLRSMDGTERLLGYVPPSRENSYLASVVGVYEPELMGHFEATSKRQAAMLLAASLIAALVTALVAWRFISLPTKALIDASKEWREGNLAARAPPLGGSEFGQLAEAYNAMAAAVERREEAMRDYSHSLEAAVAERTRAITEVNEHLQAEMNERRATEEALLQSQKVQAVGQLAGGIAHDFNNVLQAVLGGVALLRRREGDPQAVQRLADLIEDSARRGESITRRLLTFSRREELRAVPLDVGELLHAMREILSATLGPRIHVQVVANDTLPQILADRGLLETVLVNLATNARDAMTRGGTLTLAASTESEPSAGEGSALAPGEYVRIAVVDTGIGMDAKTLSRAAEPFFTTKPLGKGTGLGLAMAWRFAKDSGGHLSIDSTPGRGTTVLLWLPVLNEPTKIEPSAGIANLPLSRAGHRRPHVLLVDDEPAVREVLAAQLQDVGFAVTPVEDGAAALGLLRASVRFDVMITDLAMPGLDGVALIKEAQVQCPDLPVILITGYAGDAATLAVSGEIGRRFVLVRKPVSGSDLVDRTWALLEMSARAADAAAV